MSSLPDSHRIELMQGTCNKVMVRTESIFLLENTNLKLEQCFDHELFRLVLCL